MVQQHLWSFVQETSKQAYSELLNDGVLGTQEAEYYRLLCHHHEGLTDGEAASILGWQRSTVSARRNGINKTSFNTGEGYAIINTGQRRKNPGIKSKTALVWVRRTK